MISKELAEKLKFSYANLEKCDSFNSFIDSITEPETKKSCDRDICVNQESCEECPMNDKPEKIKPLKVAPLGIETEIMLELKLVSKINEIIKHINGRL